MRPFRELFDLEDLSVTMRPCCTIEAALETHVRRTDGVVVDELRTREARDCIGSFGDDRVDRGADGTARTIVIHLAVAVVIDEVADLDRSADMRRDAAAVGIADLVRAHITVITGDEGRADAASLFALRGRAAGIAVIACEPIGLCHVRAPSR